MPLTGLCCARGSARDQTSGTSQPDPMERCGKRAPLFSAALAPCHSVPLARASAFRATSNAQKGAIGSNSDQRICSLTSEFPEMACSENHP
jgi:hypothetical protein